MFSCFWPGRSTRLLPSSAARAGPTARAGRPSQLFPAATLSLLPNNFVTKWGAGAGIAAGVATVTYVTVAGTTIGDLLPFLPQVLADTNIGIVALFVNFAVMIGVSFATGGFAVRREQSV
ncbi:MAG: hypothetical protein M3534_17455 [Actinomycetota bacterium]|nr:hypothetical protein [Actinomycetota bacterium]